MYAVIEQYTSLLHVAPEYYIMYLHLSTSKLLKIELRPKSIHAQITCKETCKMTPYDK